MASAIGDMETSKKNSTIAKDFATNWMKLAEDGNHKV
jgi:hypothetical protein